MVENNFNTLDFLAKGGYTLVHRNVWPGCSIPGPATLLRTGKCNTATVDTGGPYIVNSGRNGNLERQRHWRHAYNFAWSAPAQGTLSALNIASPVYTAPVGGNKHGGEFCNSR